MVLPLDKVTQLSNFSFNNLITEVLPIFSRLAISALLNPFPWANSFLTSSFLFAAARGRPCALPLLLASAIPAFTRSFKIERSNSANTASIPANAFPDGVVK